MNVENNIICIGEVLWDALPSGIFLGGAPLNVAVNLTKMGIQAHIISATGDDTLGKLALKSIQYNGLSTDYIQLNEEPTGLVEVVLKNGSPRYTFNSPAAWDFVDYIPSINSLLTNSSYLVFGSLASRNVTSRRTISLCTDANTGKNVFDVNMRKPFIEERLILNLIKKTDILKINEDELEIIAGWLGYSLPEKELLIRISDDFNLETVLLTKGSQGASMLHHDSWSVCDGIDITVTDTVGAGDGFLAAILYGLCKENHPDEILHFANRTGAWIACQSGATPELPIEKLLV